MQREINGNFELQKANNEIIPIEQKNIFISRKKLGHHKAPSRTYKRQTEAIFQVADEIADEISKLGASRSMAKLFFTKVWISAVRYILAQSFLFKEQFSSIDTKMSKLLGKFGYSMLQARQITEALVCLGGVRCPPAYAMTSSGYIKHLLKNFQSPDELAGSTLRVVVS